MGCASRTSLGRRRVARLVIGLIVAVAFVALARGPARRVGDGSEYYALEIAWRETWRPFMTERAWAAYEALRTSGVVTGLSDRAFLERAYGWMAVHDAGVTTLDFNHFWLESGLAAIASALLRALGISGSPHAGFLLLHATLLVALFDRSFRARGVPGVLASCTLLLATPVLWYVDKAHTELFTFALTTYAVVAFWDRRPGSSALALALASTQNPSFALPAVVAAAIDLRRGPRREAVARAAVVLGTSLLHPAYYLARLGAPTPQLHSGGAAPLLHLRDAWVYVLDLDVGLLGHAAPVLLLAAAGLAFGVRRDRRARALFVTSYLLSCVVAHASTTNLNSGGTPGIGRYALWYLALLQPPLADLIVAARKRASVRALAVVVGITGFVLAYDEARPSVAESCGRPTRLSAFVQTRMPWLYDPPAEIFAERWGGVEEATEGVAVVIGPDCRKVLVLAPPDRGRVLSPPGCLVLRGEPLRLARAVRGELPTYAAAQLASSDAAAFALRDGTWFDASEAGALDGWRGAGFSQPEPWGTWTDGTSATLHVPCVPSAASVAELDLVPFTGGTRTSARVSVRLAGGGDATDVALHERQVVRAAIPPAACALGVATLLLEPQAPASPASLGLSDDARQLGVALVRFRVTRLDGPPRAAANPATLVGDERSERTTHASRRR